jgi:hypothetical protein
MRRAPLISSRCSDGEWEKKQGEAAGEEEDAES